MSESDLPGRFILDLAAITTQDEYGEAAFELLRETSELVLLLVHAIPKQPFQRNEVA